MTTKRLTRPTKLEKLKAKRMALQEQVAEITQEITDEEDLLKFKQRENIIGKAFYIITDYGVAMHAYTKYDDESVSHRFIEYYEKRGKATGFIEHFIKNVFTEVVPITDVQVHYFLNSDFAMPLDMAFFEREYGADFQLTDVLTRIDQYGAPNSKYHEPCPEPGCDGTLKAMPRGGVKCTKCPYWFCF